MEKTIGPVLSLIVLEYCLSCTESITDQSASVVYLKVGKRTKRVRHYHGCKGIDLLRDLYRLEAAIDQTAESAKWVK